MFEVSRISGLKLPQLLASVYGIIPSEDIDREDITFNTE